MALSDLNAAVTIRFNPLSAAENAGSLFLQVDPEKESSDLNKVYLRLYPDLPCTSVTSSGSLSRLGSYREDVEEVVVFTGSRSVTLGKIPNGSVRLENLGSIHPAPGAATGPQVTYNAATNAVEANVDVYGIVRAKYQARYRSYVYTFSGQGCGPGELPLQPGVVLVFRPEDGSSAHLSLEPPACSEGVIPRGEEAKVPSISLEVHKDYPPRLIAANVWGLNAGNLVAGCKIRVTPGDSSYTIACSPGELTASDDELTDEDISEASTFNNAASMNLQYQPRNASISVRKLSRFYDQYGEEVNPVFATWGDRISEVEWLDNGGYRYIGQRIVRRDEIVATVGARIAKPVTGAVQPDYSIRSKIYDLVFRRILTPNGNVAGWQDSYVFSYDGQETGFLRVEPPTFTET